MYTPLNYNQLNVVEGAYSPSMVKSYNNKTFDFWARSLFQRAVSTLDFSLPEEWEGSPRDLFLYTLFRYGYLAVFKTSEFGLTFNPCTLTGQGFYYQPTRAIVSNPLYSKEMNIGTECELVRLTPDYRGIWDIIQYYAEKLSTLDTAINMSLINNKYAFLLGARNKTGGEALKKMIDKVNHGEPAVIFDLKLLNDPQDKDTPFQFWEREHLKESYLTTDQLKDFQTLLNNFDAEVGIPTIPYEKAERMVSSEAESRVVDSSCRSLVWFDTLKSSIANVKKLYPEILLDVSRRFDTDVEVGNGKVDNDRNE